VTNELPKISIITPSYNQGKFIRQTIESIQAQNYPNYEHIIVDACSTDDTVEILKSYGNTIQWISEKDKGQADAINKGIRMATGQILAYINSDDYYLPGAFFRVAQGTTGLSTNGAARSNRILWRIKLFSAASHPAPFC
jgi:glycosyltransferase involved in cell wall biosynthesis